MPSEDVQRFRLCNDPCTLAQSGGRHPGMGNRTCSPMRTDSGCHCRQHLLRTAGAIVVGFSARTESYDEQEADSIRFQTPNGCTRGRLQHAAGRHQEPYPYRAGYIIFCSIISMRARWSRLYWPCSTAHSPSRYPAMMSKLIIDVTNYQFDVSLRNIKTSWCHNVHSPGRYLPEKRPCVQPQRQSAINDQSWPRRPGRRVTTGTSVPLFGAVK
jgi:hypothetical protein